MGLPSDYDQNLLGQNRVLAGKHGDFGLESVEQTPALVVQIEFPEIVERAARTHRDPASKEKK